MTTIDPTPDDRLSAISSRRSWRPSAPPASPLAARPRPVAERRGVRAEPGPPLPLAVGRGADRDDQDRDQGRRRGRHASRRRRRQRRSRTTRRAATRSATASGRPAASTASPASPAMLRTASRCGCASRATSSTGARSSGARPTPRHRTGATTPRRSPSTSSATSRASATTSTATTIPTTSTPSSRRTRGRSRAPAGTCTTFGRCDTATLQMPYDVPSSTAKYSTCLDLSTVLTLTASSTAIAVGSATTLTATLKVVDDDGLPAASAATPSPAERSPSSDVLPVRRPGRPSARWVPARRPAPTCSPSGRRATTDYRAVFTTPSNEGINGDSSPVVRVVRHGRASRRPPAAAEIAAPCL